MTAKSTVLDGVIERLRRAPNPFGLVTVHAGDLHLALSVLASLRAANAEQRAVIERLTRPVDAIGKVGACSAVVSPRLCSRTACAGDVADFVRDADEMGATRGGPCISCGHRDGDWCVHLSRPCSDVCHGCYAHVPKGGAK